MTEIRMKLFGAVFAVIAVVFAVAPVHAEDLAFMLINKTRANVVGFFVSHTGTSDWGENLLDGGYLASGYGVRVTIADGRRTCGYDILSEFDDGEEIEDYDVDLCELEEFFLEE